MKFHTLLLALVFALSLPGQIALAEEGKYLTYSELIAKIDAGTVKSVTLDHFSSISGVYVADGAEKVFHSYGATGSANDVLLIRLLDEKKVATTISEKKDRMDPFGGAAVFSGLLLFAAPIITLVLAFVINSKLNRLLFPPPIRTGDS